MNKAQKQIIKEWRKGHNKYMENKTIEIIDGMIVGYIKEENTKQPTHNICSGCNETIRPDQWSENNFTLCIDCG